MAAPGPLVHRPLLAVAPPVPTAGMAPALHGVLNQANHIALVGNVYVNELELDPAVPTCLLHFLDRTPEDLSVAYNPAHCPALVNLLPTAANLRTFLDVLYRPAPMLRRSYLNALQDFFHADVRRANMVFCFARLAPGENDKAAAWLASCRRLYEASHFPDRKVEFGLLALEMWDRYDRKRIELNQVLTNVNLGLTTKSEGLEEARQLTEMRNELERRLRFFYSLTPAECFVDERNEHEMLTRTLCLQPPDYDTISLDDDLTAIRTRNLPALCKVVLHPDVTAALHGRAAEDNTVINQIARCQPDRVDVKADKANAFKNRFENFFTHYTTTFVLGDQPIFSINAKLRQIEGLLKDHNAILSDPPVDYQPIVTIGGSDIDIEEKIQEWASNLEERKMKLEDERKAALEEKKTEKNMVQKSLAKLVLPTLTHGLTTLTWIRVLGQLSAQVHSPHQLAQLIRASFSPEDDKNTAGVWSVNSLKQYVHAKYMRLESIIPRAISDIESLGRPNSHSKMVTNITQSLNLLSAFEEFSLLDKLDISHIRKLETFSFSQFAFHQYTAARETASLAEDGGAVRDISVMWGAGDLLSSSVAGATDGDGGTGAAAAAIDLGAELRSLSLGTAVSTRVKQFRLFASKQLRISRSIMLSQEELGQLNQPTKKIEKKVIVPQQSSKMFNIQTTGGAGVKTRQQNSKFGPCPIRCGSEHQFSSAASCEVFKSQDQQTRLNTIKKSHLCHLCLRRAHNDSRDCPIRKYQREKQIPVDKRKRCYSCKSPSHHYLACPNPKPSASEQKIHAVQGESEEDEDCLEDEGLTEDEINQLFGINEDEDEEDGETTEVEAGEAEAGEEQDDLIEEEDQDHSTSDPTGNHWFGSVSDIFFNHKTQAVKLMVTSCLEQPRLDDSAPEDCLHDTAASTFGCTTTSDNIEAKLLDDCQTLHNLKCTFSEHSQFINIETGLADRPVARVLALLDSGADCSAVLQSTADRLQLHNIGQTHRRIVTANLTDSRIYKKYKLVCNGVDCVHPLETIGLQQIGRTQRHSANWYLFIKKLFQIPEKVFDKICRPDRRTIEVLIGARQAQLLGTRITWESVGARPHPACPNLFLYTTVLDDGFYLSGSLGLDITGLYSEPPVLSIPAGYKYQPLPRIPGSLQRAAALLRTKLASTLQETTKQIAFMHNIDCPKYGQTHKIMFNLSDCEQLRKYVISEVDWTPGTAKCELHLRPPVCDDCAAMKSFRSFRDYQFYRKYLDNLTAVKDKNGKFNLIQKLIFIDDPNSLFPGNKSNYEEALKSSKRVLKILRKKGLEKTMEYNGEWQKGVKEGCFVALSAEEIARLPTTAHAFLSHSITYKETSLSSKARLLANPSVLVSNSGRSLNSALALPHNLCNNAFELALRFQTYHNYILSDLSKAYRSVSYTYPDSLLSLYVWFDSTDLENQVENPKVVIFRTARNNWGASIAGDVLEIAIRGKIVPTCKLDMTKQILNRFRYIDDHAWGTNYDLIVWNIISRDMYESYNRFNFTLKYCHGVGGNQLLSGNFSHNYDKTSETCLGMEIDFNKDEIKPHNYLALGPKRKGILSGETLVNDDLSVDTFVSRRSLSRIAAQIFDLTGRHCGPVIAAAKTLLSKACCIANPENIDTNLKSLNSDFYVECLKFLKQLQKFDSIKPWSRSNIPSTHLLKTVHFLHDGSVSGLGSTIYFTSCRKDHLEQLEWCKRIKDKVIKYKLTADELNDALGPKYLTRLSTAKSKLGRRSAQSHEILAYSFGAAHLLQTMQILDEEYERNLLFIGYTDSVSSTQLFNPDIIIKNVLIRNAIQKCLNDCKELLQLYKNSSIIFKWIPGHLMGGADFISKYHPNCVDLCNSKLWREGCDDLNTPTAYQDNVFLTITRDSVVYCPLSDKLRGIEDNKEIAKYFVHSNSGQQSVSSDCLPGCDAPSAKIFSLTGILADDKTTFEFSNSPTDHHHTQRLTSLPTHCQLSPTSTVLLTGWLPAAEYCQIIDRYSSLGKIILAFKHICAFIIKTKVKIIRRQGILARFQTVSKLDINIEAWCLLLRCSQKHFPPVSRRGIAEQIINGVRCSDLRLGPAHHFDLFHNLAIPLLSHKDPVVSRIIRYKHISTNPAPLPDSHLIFKATCVALRTGNFSVLLDHWSPVKQFINNCARCNKESIKGPQLPYSNRYLLLDNGVKPFQHISTDLLGPVKAKNFKGASRSHDTYIILIICINFGCCLSVMTDDSTAKGLAIALQLCEQRTHTQITQVSHDAAPNFTAIGENLSDHFHQNCTFIPISKSAQWRNASESRTRLFKRFVRQCIGAMKNQSLPILTYTQWWYTLSRADNLINKIPYTSSFLDLNSNLVCPAHFLTPALAGYDRLDQNLDELDYKLNLYVNMLHQQLKLILQSELKFYNSDHIRRQCGDRVEVGEIGYLYDKSRFNYFKYVLVLKHIGADSLVRIRLHNVLKEEKIATANIFRLAPASHEPNQK